MNKYLWEEFKQLGVKKSLYRIGYEFSKKSGVSKLFNPIVINNVASEKCTTISLDEWYKNAVPFFTPDFTAQEVLNKYRELFSEENKQQVLGAAKRIERGEILCFSKWWGNYGTPIDWHRNPIDNICWDKNKHYSQVLADAKKCGDIKFTWELNRFAHIYTLGRAYLLTGDEKYAQIFFNQIASWKEANPYNGGVNWANGQELAIRSFAWIWATYIFRSSLTPSIFENIQKLLYLHAKHIYQNINYARYAVHNNHLIGEALALYTIAMLFPWFSFSSKWKKFAKKLLQGVCLSQFYDDGSYCQNSHTYHRLALQYYVWFCRVAESTGDILNNRVYRTIEKSSAFLASFITSDGRFPNWGCNDGALLYPWTLCDYRDLRPLLSSLRYLTVQKRAFPKGIWEEELFHLFGSESLEALVVPYEFKSQSFESLHVLRNTMDDFVAFRCGSLKDRFGQADQLHVDLWKRGINIVVDGGTYLYNAQQQYHRYFMGSCSHNTVTVDKANQMYLHRPFKWLYWTKAKLLNYKEDYASGEHYGYHSKGIVHKREIFCKDNEYVVKDFLINNTVNLREYCLHWQLAHFPYEIVEKGKTECTIKLQMPKFDCYLKITVNCDSCFDFYKGYQDNLSVKGWSSLYYGEKSEIISIEGIVLSTENVTFVSSFRFE